MTDSRDKRKKQTGEVFTPPKLVRQMLSKLPKEIWKKGKTFCDPACGNGNFIVAVLLRKIEHGHTPFDALKTLYGVDIMRDNVQECRLRLLKVLQLFGCTIGEEHIKIVFQNIVWININKYDGGSINYDFSFKSKANINDVKRWMEWINEKNVLANIELPIQEENFNPNGMDSLFDD